jgi:predicted hydrolase (HD superfamily)
MATGIKTETEEEGLMDTKTREQTLEFLSLHVKTDMLMKHLLSVETV